MDTDKVAVICYACEWAGQIVVKRGINLDKRVPCPKCGQMWLRKNKWRGSGNG